LTNSINKMTDNLKKQREEIKDYGTVYEKKTAECKTEVLTQKEESECTNDKLQQAIEELESTAEQLRVANEETKKAKEELANFAKIIDEKVRERTAESSVLYEISNAISYTLDYQTLLKLIMESLFKIVNYDICGSLLFDENKAHITFMPAHPESARFVEEVKNSLIDSTDLFADGTIRNKEVSIFLIPTVPNINPKNKRQYDKIRSFFNVPFVVHNKTIGMINVSSCRDSAFSKDDIRIIYTIANHASNAIERLQAIISAEKSKMESLVESMIEGVIMFNEQDEIIVFNPQGKRMLGFNLAEEVTNKQLTGIMKAINLYDAFQESQNEKRLITKEITISRGEKSVVLHSDISPVRKSEGNTIGTVIILRDVTNEKEIDKMKTEFISTVSHELRTPLTIMKEFASIISDEIAGKLTKEQKEYIDIVKDNIERLIRLINDLLDISKIEAGKFELKKRIADITGLTKAAVDSLRLEVDRKHIEVKTLFPNDAMDVYVEPDKIIQVLTNLISNAIKFTPGKGTITIEIRDTEKEIECSITDNGKGIASEDMDKLFAKFQQFDRTPGAGAKGTGLGLAISKELVEAHNGRIWAESKIGEGSKFIFSLPKCSERAILYKTVEKRIIDAKKENKELSIFIIRLGDYLDDEKEPEKNKDRAEKVFLPISKTLTDVIGSEDFITCKNEIVSFLQVGKEEASNMITRLKTAIKSSICELEEEFNIDVSYGVVTYPNDADNARDLLGQAYKSCIREKESRLKKTIMIVDDEPALRNMLKEVLQTSGYSNFTDAGNGKEALEKIRTAIPDLVILDMEMPIMNGYEVIDMLKENTETKDIPVLIMSGYQAEIDMPGKCVSKGAIPVLGKPFDIDQIRRLTSCLL
jgi:PAS domain S-box-containing protein